MRYGTNLVKNITYFYISHVFHFLVNCDNKGMCEMQGPPPATTRGRAGWGLQWVLTFCVFYSVVAYYLSAAASNRYIVFQKYAFHFLSRYLLSYHIYHMYVYLLCRWRYLSKYLVINYDMIEASGIFLRPLPIKQSRNNQLRLNNSIALWECWCFYWC